jgi:hypothetical protein
LVHSVHDRLIHLAPDYLCGDLAKNFLRGRIDLKDESPPSGINIPSSELSINADWIVSSVISSTSIPCNVAKMRHRQSILYHLYQ